MNAIIAIRVLFEIVLVFGLGLFFFIKNNLILYSFNINKGYMSLKIINIDSISNSLTVDTDLITVDNDIITVDATATGVAEHNLRIVPRFYETNVILNLWDEIKEVNTELILTGVIDLGYLSLTFTYDFTEGQYLEARLTDTTGKLMWRGKIYATTQTDLENFTLNPKVNNIIKI